MNENYDALATRLRENLVDLARVVERTDRLLVKAAQQNDDDYLDGVALNLHSFYTGVEQLLEVIARQFDGSVPQGPDWHRDLLLQMSGELSGRRPPVISRATRHCLDEYRSFRHIVRNVYTFNLRPTRLRELVGDLAACFTTLVNDLEAFCVFLEGGAFTPET
ncbi:hypothetical protein [Candidatus Amarolinea aalborgensis]|uniref:ribonuclease toxin HepT-like protein n=1 Tax=Candidatus Amarolinea aalborgensis TaxID=2249329 RepID=UPI003BFA1C2F